MRVAAAVLLGYTRAQHQSKVLAEAETEEPVFIQTTGGGFSIDRGKWERTLGSLHRVPCQATVAGCNAHSKLRLEPSTSLTVLGGGHVQ